MSLYPLTQTLKGEDFSVTKKYSDWLRNERWTQGYKNLIAGAYPTNTLPTDNDGLLWVLLSTATEEIGYKLFSKIQNISRNLHDIDTCDVRSLVSYSDLLDNRESINFLTFDYPAEILDLINILSINKSLLVSDNSVLLSSKLSDIYDSFNTTLSSVVNGITSGLVSSAMPMQHYSNPASLGYTDAQWEEITSLSGDTSKYRIADDAQYLQFIEDTFVSAISANVFKRYRVYEKDGNGPYIWQEISASLDKDNLFLDNNSTDESILKLKISLDVDIDFPEVKIVNAIEDGTDSLLNYNTKEKLVLQAEIDRRRPPDYVNSLQKYAYSRERDVIRYFRFLSNFSPYIISSNFTPYAVDAGDNKLELTSDDDSPLIINSNPPQVDTSYIYSAAKYLANICVKISYFRENLRNLALKYAYAGTNLIIRKLIIDYLNKHVYDQLETWRYNNGISGEFKYLDTASPVDLAVKIIEYWDSSDYYNVSALNNDEYVDVLGDANLLSTLSYPFWLNTQGTNQAFSDAEILSFYKRLGLNLNVPNSDEDTTVEIDKLYTFLDSIYDSAALSSFNTDKKSTFYNRLTDFFTNFEVIGPTNTSSEILNPFYGFNVLGTTYHNNYFILPPPSGVDYGNIQASAVLSLTSASVIVGYNTVSALRATESNYVDLVQEVTEDILQDLTITLGESTTTEALVDRYRQSIQQQVLDRASSYFEYTYLPRADIFTTLPFIFSGTLSNIAYFGTNSDSMSGEFTGQLVESAQPTSSLNTSAYINEGQTYTFKISGSIDNTVTNNDINADIYKKYIGNTLGKAPAVNYRNSIHPSYMLHPFLKRFVTRFFSFSQFVRLVDSVYETDEEILAKKAERISSNGSLINSWKFDNREYTAYRTYYEESPNLNADYIEDAKIDVDGPWYYPALTSYLDNSASFISSISAGTNTYFQDINLTSDELNVITSAYSSIRGTADDISAMQNAKIYKLAVDAYDNTYILFKNTRELETSGKIWIRHHNHPLALPATKIIENTDHNTISAALNTAYDFDVDDGYMWCLYDDPISGKVAIGQIYRNGFNVDIQNDSIKQFETFNLSGYRYAGAYTSYDEDLGTYHIVIVATSGGAGYSGLPYDSTASSYVLPIKYFVYNPGYGDFYYSDNHYVNYDESSALTDSSKIKNIFRLSRNPENSEVAIAFESKSPNISSTEWYNSFGLKPSANYVDLYNDFDNKQTLPDNGITMLNGREIRSIGPYIYNIDVQSIKYLYPFADLTYHGLFATSPASGVAELLSDGYSSKSDGVIDEYRIQLFSNIFPCSAADQRAYFTIGAPVISGAPIFNVHTTISSSTNVITLDSNVNNTQNISFSTANQSGYLYMPESAISAVITDVAFTYKYWAQYTGRNSLIIQGMTDGSGDMDVLFTDDSLYGSTTYGFETEIGQLILVE